MAIDIVWLDEAERNLQSVFDYISSDNPSAAETYVESILSACDRLRDFPLSGRVFDERYRVLVVLNHLVFYRCSDDNTLVTIVAVIDGRRDVGAILGED